MLLVMRHAKSDWSVEVGDHQRPLNKRGVKAARTMGELITEMNLAPDLIISSTAVRAASTAKLAAEAGQWDCPIRETDDFYESSVKTVIEELRTLDDEVERCLIVGHDTTWNGIVRELTGANVAMRTATVAVIENVGPWKKLGKTSAELVSVLQPRHFES